MTLIILFVILHALRIAPGGDDATRPVMLDGVQIGVRSYTSRPVAFVSAPGFQVQTVCGCLPDSLYDVWEVLPQTHKIVEFRAERNGCLPRFITVGQRIVMVLRAGGVR